MSSPLTETRLLSAEVVGRDADDDEALILVLLVERLQTGVLRSESALAGDVDDQHDLAFEFGKRDRLAVDAVESELVDGAGCWETHG
jgi:hypothetical protein